MAFSAIIWGAGDNVGPVPVGATVNVTAVDGLQCSALFADRMSERNWSFHEIP